jgi:hypothetical protein
LTSKAPYFGEIRLECKTLTQRMTATRITVSRPGAVNYSMDENLSYVCSKFSRQSFFEDAEQSTQHSFWARAYYSIQRMKGKGHNAAVRRSSLT